MSTPRTSKRRRSSSKLPTRKTCEALSGRAMKRKAKGQPVTTMDLRKYVALAMSCRALTIADIAYEAAIDPEQLSHWIQNEDRIASRTMVDKLKGWLLWIRGGKKLRPLGNVGSERAESIYADQKIVAPTSWLNRRAKQISSHIKDVIASSSNDVGKSNEREDLEREPYVLISTARGIVSEGLPRGKTMIPIRLDIDLNEHRLLDAFLWCADEYQCSPEVFAENLVDDENLPHCFVQPIADSIRRQICTHMQITKTSSTLKTFNANQSSPIVNEKTPRSEEAVGRKDSLRPVCIDITIGRVAFHDQFEWDTSCELNDAVDFSRSLCKDLHLPGPFEAAIAFAIEEQVSRPRLHGVVSTSLAQKPSSSDPVRNQEETSIWSPVVAQLSVSERNILRRLDHHRARASSQRIEEDKEGTDKESMVVTWTGCAQDSKVPRQIHAFTAYLRDLRCQSSKALRGEIIQRCAEERWQRLPEIVHDYYAHVAEKRNVRKNKLWRDLVRLEGIALWEDEEADRKNMRGGSNSGDLFTKSNVALGLRASRKVRNESSNNLYTYRVNERRENQAKFREDRNGNP
eukprot:g390.t1